MIAIKAAAQFRDALFTVQILPEKGVGCRVFAKARYSACVEGQQENFIPEMWCNREDTCSFRPNRERVGT